MCEEGPPFLSTGRREPEVDLSEFSLPSSHREAKNSPGAQKGGVLTKGTRKAIDPGPCTHEGPQV